MMVQTNGYGKGRAMFLIVGYPGRKPPPETLKTLIDRLGDYGVGRPKKVSRTQLKISSQTELHGIHRVKYLIVHIWMSSVIRRSSVFINSQVFAAYNVCTDTMLIVRQITQA
jgi:hypothetical protein